MYYMMYILTLASILNNNNCLPMNNLIELRDQWIRLSTIQANLESIQDINEIKQKLPKLLRDTMLLVECLDSLNGNQDFSILSNHLRTSLAIIYMHYIGLSGYLTIDLKTSYAWNYVIINEYLTLL